MSTTKNKLKQSFPYRFLRKLEQDLRKAGKKYSMLYRLKKAPPVFIYQMGKVASSSIHHSLKKQYPGPVAHAHHIGSDNWASELFYKWYQQGHTIKIISPIRDPIGYNISSFFQGYSDYTKNELEQLELSIEKLIDNFIAKYPHETPLVWFDNNIKKHFGVDVYKTPFPQKGPIVYSSANASVLVFKIDLNDSLKEDAIKDFLELKSFKLHNKNISSNKEYYHIYKRFINKIKLPEAYLSKMKNSKYFNHFYTLDEIKKIISRWE